MQSRFYLQPSDAVVSFSPTACLNGSMTSGTSRVWGRRAEAATVARSRVLSPLIFACAWWWVKTLDRHRAEKNSPSPGSCVPVGGGDDGVVVGDAGGGKGRSKAGWLCCRGVEGVGATTPPSPACHCRPRALAPFLARPWGRRRRRGLRRVREEGTKGQQRVAASKEDGAHPLLVSLTQLLPFPLTAALAVLSPQRTRRRAAATEHPRRRSRGGAAEHVPVEAGGAEGAPPPPRATWGSAATPAPAPPSSPARRPRRLLPPHRRGKFRLGWTVHHLPYEIPMFPTVASTAILQLCFWFVMLGICNAAVSWLEICRRVTYQRFVVFFRKFIIIT
jgi:hypothetical protein